MTWFRREPVDTWLEEVPSGLELDRMVARIRAHIEEEGIS